jgi:hypothetical protein
MPYKDLEVRKAYLKAWNRKHYEKNRKELIERASVRRKQLREKWHTFKLTLKCTTCGFSHPAALDFHHEDPTKKEAHIHRLLQNGLSAKLRKELKKCIVLCANCHRIHHYDERQDKKMPPSLLSEGATNSRNR